MDFSPLKRIALFLSLGLMLAVLNVAAQDNGWRSVSPAELQLKTPMVEPDADAEAIFWEVRIDDSSSEDLSRFNYVRVKIFNERGREKYSKFDVPFIKGRSKIKDLAARVIKPDGSIVEIGKADIFEREIVKIDKTKVRAMSFAVPNIEPGVIVEYRYREVIEDAGAKGLHLEFQRDIPVQNLTYYYKPYDKEEPNFQAFNTKDVKFIKDEKGFYRATQLNVPAFREEPQMPPEDMVKPWILLRGASLRTLGSSAFGISYVIKDPKDRDKYWGAVATENADLVKFINKPDKKLKKAAEEIIASAATQDEKLAKIYGYLQTHIKNLTFTPSVTDEEKKAFGKIDSLAAVLDRQQGNSQYIDMLFGAMASALGYETRVAFSGDRSEMFFNPNMVNEKFIHPAAIAVKFGERWKYFNPGVPFLPYGSLLWNEEGVFTMLVGEKNYIWDQIPLTGVDKTVAKRTGNFNLLEDGTLEGTVSVEYNGQTANTYRVENYDDSAAKRESDLIGEIKTRISNAEISDLSIENFEDNSKPLIEKYKIRVPNYAQKTGKRLFFQPGFFEYGETALFPGASRKYDIYFKYPWAEEDLIHIKLPSGYELDNAETPAGIADPQKISQLTVSIAIERDTNTLDYNRKFFFGNGENISFPVKSYEPLKGLFDTFSKIDSHTITLKQAK